MPRLEAVTRGYALSSVIFDCVIHPNRPATDDYAVSGGSRQEFGGSYCPNATDQVKETIS
jgi:hypothetical protein